MPFAWKDVPVSVLKRTALSETVILVRVGHAARDGREFEWLPGQHIEVAPPGAPDASHFYSIASARDAQSPGQFELVMSLSASPKLMRELEPGRTLLVSAARGDFVWEPAPGPLVLVGIGTGVAPLRAMLQAALQHSDDRVAIVLGARTEASLLFRDEFEQLARRDTRFRFEPVLSRPSENWRGSRGRVQDHLQRVLSEVPPVRAYVCGTTTMVRDTVALLTRLGISPASVRGESHGD